MSAGTLSTKRVLETRLEEIATAWCERVSGCETGEVIRQHFIGWTRQIIALLTAEELDREQAQALGAALMRCPAFCTDILGATLETLPPLLTAGLPPEQTVALLPRLSAILGEMGNGFVRTSAEDDSETCLSTVRKRTAELMRAIDYLEQETTDRARAVEALRESEEKYRLLTEAARDIILALDLDGRIIHVNRAGLEISGYSEQDVHHANIEDFLPPEYLTEIRQWCARWHAGDDFDSVHLYRTEFINKEGQRVPVEVSSTPLVKQGRIIGVLIVARDISERIRAEEALQRRNRELAALERASHALTSMLDIGKVLTTVLEEVRHLMNATASSIWLMDDERQHVVCRHATGPRKELVLGWTLPVGQGIVGWVAQSGRYLIVPDTRQDQRHFKQVDREIGIEMRSILSVPLRARQRVIGVLQVLHTEVNRFGESEQGLLESLAASAAIAIENARLIDALRRRTAELESRNEELDAFASTVAHDLQNPLSLIVGYAESLEEQYRTLSNEEVLRYLRRIARSGRKVSNIVDEILILAGVRQAKADVSPLDMAAIIAEVQQRLGDMLDEYQAELILPAEWPTVLGYGPWIEEVWVNYVSNALKHGGRPPRVELGATVQENGMARFWVRDNGPGIPPEDRAALFKPFTRFGQVDTKGHGLGLSIVLRIVEKLGGRVGADDVPGGGSEFYFTLPLAQFS